MRCWTLAAISVICVAAESACRLVAISDTLIILKKKKEHVRQSGTKVLVGWAEGAYSAGSRKVPMLETSSDGTSVSFDTLRMVPMSRHLEWGCHL
jgi:hypothetical protein